MRNDERIEAMLKMARELAARGHRPQMIEAVLVANGFREAPEFIGQQHVHRELTEIAERARQRHGNASPVNDGDDTQ